MSLTSREPSTKFYGPNYRFVDAANPNHWLITLHNLQPGDHWNPGDATELDAQLTFIPFGPVATWLWMGTAFFAAWAYAPTFRELAFFHFATASFAFRFTIPFAVTKWCVNELVEPADNFAFGGTAEIIFRKG